ncbi:MAG: hypothetical protein HOP12_16370 [Candidatus Eisenbacteria bacterium]|uniref:PH domain-containing protein n=1 Tax=Eiseniibacteriota bacterium TaxID=2212470 RepID=A0A849SRS4_UNCEI|nr:hypothetical protein [Candidatus Eisenbacteria bacterium]
MMPDSVEWSFRPWRDRPAVTWRALAAATASVALVWFVVGETPLRVALGIVVAASFVSACLPVHCRIDADGVSYRNALGMARRGWNEVRRATMFVGGVRLSAYSGRHWLAGFRDLDLPLPLADRDRLVERIRPVLAAHGL